MSVNPPALGIDISADRIHVARSLERSDPVITLEYENPDWYAALIALVEPGATVAIEPTGWHYSAPVIAALHHAGAEVLQVEHRITGKVRDLRISGIKNDHTDARALYYIASQHATTPLLGVHPISPRNETATTELRMLIQDHQRAQKESTRAKNRLHQLGHSIWPSLGSSLSTYQRAIAAGAITPDELRTLAAELTKPPYPPGYSHKTTRQNLIALVKTLPDWLHVDYLRQAIATAHTHQAENAARADDLEQLIVAAITADPFAELTALWSTVPSASMIGIAALHVATHGHAAELTASQFKASVGSHPHISQSGETSQSAEARQGYRPAKRALYLWTMQLIKAGNNPVAAAYARHKSAADDRKYNIQAARAKLCIILSAIARTGQPYSPREEDQS